MPEDIIIHECDACGKTIEHDLLQSSIPRGWYIRVIHGEMHLLCKECGSEDNFRDGVSPAIIQALKARGQLEEKS